MKECSQFPGRLRDLCEGRGLDGRGDPPRYAVEAFRAQQGLWPLGSEPYPEGIPRRPCPPAAPRTVAVAVICHNYGRYLAEALDSVLTQTRQPDEIIVIDDSSTDDTPRVAATYADRGVRCQRVTVQNVHQARRAGFEATESQAICFLDADDKLGADYLDGGLAQFTEPRVAVVYSDVEHFDGKTGRSSYPEFSAETLQQDNLIHAGSLVRREALEISQPFTLQIDPLQTQADWFLWRRVLVGNWTARKQGGTYFYRQHQANWMHAMRRVDSPRRYFDYAGLCHETVTLFIPLSGRREFWPRLTAFLERQHWPHAQTKLILVDTSRDETFHADVRSWMARCDYGDVRHLRHSVEEAGLADDDRHNGHVRQRVVKAMWRIYDILPRVAETEYLWVLEDDILPPDDVCARLLRGFDARTASVAAPYLSRYHAQFLTWDQQGQAATAPGEGLEVVGGNGFGCTILRRSVIGGHVFTRYQDAEDYDIAFYRRLAGTPFVAKVDWDAPCQHGNAEPPSLWKRMFNFGTAVVRHAADGLKKVEDATYAQRLATCGSCASCDPLNWVCREQSCGCHLKTKAGWRSESCPLGKWDKNLTADAPPPPPPPLTVAIPH